MQQESRKNTFSNTAQNNQNEMDVEKLISSLIEGKWLIIGLTTILVIIGIIYSLFTTPIYRSDALVQVEQQDISNSLLTDISSFIPDAQPSSAAEIELIKSRMVLGKTVRTLKMDILVEEDFFPIFGEGWARIIGSRQDAIAIDSFNVPNSMIDKTFSLEVVDGKNFILSDDKNQILKGVVNKESKDSSGISIRVSNLDADPGTKFNIKKTTELKAINSILDNLTVADKGKDTGVLALSYTGEDKGKVIEVLNSIINNYQVQNVERKSAEAGQSLTFLNAQLPVIRHNLDVAEDKLNAYRQKQDSVDLSLEAKSVLDTMVSLQTQLDTLTFKETDISKLYTKDHPAYRALLEKRETLLNEKSDLEKRINGMPQTQQEIVRLTRDVDSNQQIYMQLLSKQQELGINKASTIGYVRIIDPAAGDTHPIKPNKLIILVVTTVLGFAFSAGLVMVLALFKKGIESAEELESVGINVYANIPLSNWQNEKDKKIFELNKRGIRKNKQDGKGILSVENPADIAIESIRSLRTSLHFAMMEAKNNILMISGASPAVGKTFVSSNLAAVLAQSGQRVLLIDADLRRGYLHDIFNFETKAGLSDILIGKANSNNVIGKTNVENLFLLPRGTIMPNPSELIMGEEFSLLMDWASKQFDIVVIDTPPVLAVTDAAIIGRYTGTNMLVARYSESTLSEIDVSIRRFEHAGVEIKGVILNAIVKKTLDKYAYYHYSYE